MERYEKILIFFYDELVILPQGIKGRECVMN